MAPIRIGIIGYGNSSRVYHLPYIHKLPDYTVVAFLQRAEPTKGSPHVTVDYPDARWHRSIEDFCSDKEIDAAVVITGHDSHFALAKSVLESGKHVAVEKPFTCTSQEADELIQLAKSKGKVLAPFQNRRYDADFRTLEHIVNENLLGDIHEAIIHYDIQAPSWATNLTGPDFHPGSGLNFGIGCHSLDQALALFGTPSTVTAFYRSLRPEDSATEDTFTMILQYADSKRIVTVKTNTYTFMVPLKYLVRGKEGAYVKYGDDPQEGQHYAGMSHDDPKFGYEDPELYGELTTKTKVLDGQAEVAVKDNATGKKLWRGKYPTLKGDYGLFYADFAAAIRGERELKVKAETSRDGIKVIERARESAESGKTVNF